MNDGGARSVVLRAVSERLLERKEGGLASEPAFSLAAAAADEAGLKGARRQ